MLSWKGQAGFLYQTEDARERAGQWRDRQKERESVRDRALLEERESIGNKIDH
jgi:hypothetical protein